MPSFRRIDLHLHTTISDGSDTPQALLALVRQAGIGLFSVTDHDALKAGRIIPPLLSGDDPAFLTGVEFSCRDAQGKYHILGYGFDPEAAPITSVVGKGHQLRMDKVQARLAFLRSEFGFSFPQEELDRLLALDNPGKPHIGNLMVQYGYARTKEEAIRDYINLLHLPGAYIRPEEAIAAILGSGGVPVLAHPAYGDGEQRITGRELETRVQRLMDFGLKGLEAFYSGFSPELRREVLRLAERNRLYATAGSDYHGTNKQVKLGDTGLGGPEEWPDSLRQFLADTGHWT